MLYRFDKHYSLDEARALLPQIRIWLDDLGRLRTRLAACDEKLHALRPSGPDLGGETVNSWVKTMADMRDLLFEFYRREIQIKDLDRGLIDFPAIIENKEVFLCWEQKEPDIAHWHDLEAGYAGRKPL